MIISIDVGIKNLSYCILKLNPDKTYSIINWDVINLLDINNKKKHEVFKYMVDMIFKENRLDEKQKENGSVQSKPKNIKSDTKLINLLRQAIDATEDDDGWAELGPVGSHISNKTSFDTRNYGYTNLSSLIKAIDLFELRRGSGNAYQIRDKRKKRE